jgi:hypothetical protein
MTLAKIAFVLSALVLCSACTAQTQTNTIAVNVSVIGGGVISDIPLVVWSKSSPPAMVRTDASGNATATIQSDVTDTEFSIKSAAWYSPGATVEDRLDLLEVWQSKMRQYHFERLYVVPLQAGVTSYQKNIVVRPAITVTGTVVGESGNPGKAWAIHSGMVDPKLIEAGSNTFVVGGVPRSEVSHVFVGNQNVVKRFVVPSSAVDLDLGELSVFAAEATTPVRVRLPAFEPSALSKREIGGAGVTLLRTDGSFVLTYPAIQVPEGLLGVAKVSEGTVPVVPPGEYFVIPGTFFAWPLQVKLWNAVLAGAVIPGSIPRLNASGSAEVLIEVDSLAVLQAIANMP